MKILLAVILLASCSSLRSADWVEETVAEDLQEWDWCELVKHGPQYADKGWCWPGKEVKRRFLRSDEFRTKMYFCAFQDVACMKHHKLDRKTLVNQ